jgi:hypothetical protein
MKFRLDDEPNFGPRRTGRLHRQTQRPSGASGLRCTAALSKEVMLCPTDGDFARFHGLRWLNPIASYACSHSRFDRTRSLDASRWATESPATKKKGFSALRSVNQRDPSSRPEHRSRKMDKPVEHRQKVAPRRSRGSASKTAPEKELTPQECAVRALNKPAYWRSTVNYQNEPNVRRRPARSRG